MPRSIPAIALLLVSVASCGKTAPGYDVCLPGSAYCLADPSRLLVCSDDGTGWEEVDCDEGTVCYDGACRAMACAPGAVACGDGGLVRCLDDGSGWAAPEPCGDGQACVDGECVDEACPPGALRCRADGAVERCAGDGSGWLEDHSCPEGTSCLEGICLAESCEPGARECGPAAVLACGDDGTWTSLPCPTGQQCVFGRCVECVGDGGCDDGESCVDGLCVAQPLEIVTDSLPPGTVGVPYSVVLEAEGGSAPYGWSLSAGSLLEGLTLSEEGVLSGTPGEAGSEEITVEVTDAHGAVAARDLSLEVLSAGAVRIVTDSLPAADHGLAYRTSLEAAGGALPYGWQLLAGELPGGLVLQSNGVVVGVPEEVGDFPLTVRVVDASSPPGYDSRDLELTVRIAPLEIIGDREYDLLLTKIIILPILVPFIPYSTTLQARGGLEPYAWAEETPPDGLGWIISEWGFPDALTLSDSGRLSGWVTDVSDAQVISIPFGPELAGYFFRASVTDSQDPADSDEAIFCIPTVAI